LAERGRSGPPGFPALRQALTEGRIAPVYYLHGEEPRLRDEALSAIRSALFGEGAAAEVFNVDRLDAETADPAELIDAANQLPVLAPRRLVIVRSAERLLRADTGAGDEGALSRYLRKPSPVTCLVLLGEKPDMRLRLAKEIAAAGVVCELATPKDQALVSWLQEEAGRLGKRLQPDAAALIVAFSGNVLTASTQELAKLAAFVGDRKDIRVGDVEEAVKDRQVVEIWAFTDAVKARDAGVALETLDRYLSGFRRLDDALFPLLGMLRGELRILIHAREAQEEKGLRGGALAEALTAEFRIHPMRARKAAEASLRFSRRDLASALRRLLDVDRRLKSGATPPRLLLDAWVWRTCGGTAEGNRAARAQG
jgi:DNA polymerase-3 subunit delta